MIAAANILGIGAVTPLGRGLDQISNGIAAKSAERPPIRRVPDDLLAEPQIAKSMRRADRFIKMAAIAALDAWNQAGDSNAGIPPEQIGLIVTSGLGPHVRGFKFLDGILDAGDADALPTDFSHSVHGAAASYIAGLLDLRGPSLTATDFEIGFEQAVLLAQCWLDQGVCRRVLVGAVEELGETMLKLSKELLHDRESIYPSEGAVFLMLADSKTPGVARIDASSTPEKIGLLVHDEPAIVPEPESISKPAAAIKSSFTGDFGHNASGSAFQLLGAFLTLTEDGRSAFDNAVTFRTSCGQPATLWLSTK
jgi:hypothetical protein